MKHLIGVLATFVIFGLFVGLLFVAVALSHIIGWVTP